jgi:hypothetical protein
MATKLKIEKWSKLQAFRQQAILKPNEAIKTLAEYHVKGASFNPTNMKLEAGLPEGDWMEIGRALVHVYMSAHFWLGDWIEYGRRAYGIHTAYDLARQATGLSINTLRGAARCARIYLPEKRHAALSYMHHLQLAKYPEATRDKLLAEAEELGLTMRQVRKAAEEEHGKREQENPTERINVTLHLWPETYERLQAMARASGGQVNWFITRALEDWMTIKGEAKYIRAELTTAERRARWEAEGICIFCGTNPATEGRKTCEQCRAAGNAAEKYRDYIKRRRLRGRSGHHATAMAISQT